MPHATAFLSPSVARWYDPFVYVVITITLFAALRDADIGNHALAFVLIAGVMLPMLVAEWLRARKTLPPLPAPATTPLAHRVMVKWIGVMLVVILMLFLWWLIPFYKGTHYKPLFTLTPLLLPWFALLLIPYLTYTEWRLGEARDYAWHIGLLPLARSREVDWRIVRDGLLSRLVRTIFLPLNLCYILNAMGTLRARPWHLIADAPTPESHALILSAIYALLIIAIIPGYIFSFRLLNTHTRAVDRSWFGWVVTLCCYPPLLSGVFGQWLAYNPFRFEEPFIKPWLHLFADTLPMLYAIGIGIIVMELVHLWGEAILGIRSSNLTHRGIITNGPFRTLRHPIYLAKCIGWFLIAMPILMADTTLGCVRNTLLFSIICLIYYLRSIAEERLLSIDPDYVAYALWVDQHGLLAWLGKHIPLLTFAWRHKHWHQKTLSH